MNKLYTIQDIKLAYELGTYQDNAILSFEEFLQSNFIAVYDKDLSFMGYESNMPGNIPYREAQEDPYCEYEE